MSREIKKFTSMTRRDVVPFDVDDKHYVLVCANGAAARRYRELSFRDAELEFSSDEEDKKRIMRRMGGMAAVESQLVADCCFEVPTHAANAARTPIDVETVEGWPGDVQKWAFDEVKAISPWLQERGDGKDVERLKVERAKIDERIKTLEATDPKG